MTLHQRYMLKINLKHVGIEFEEYLYDANINEDELFDIIEKLNNDKSVSGILLQAPIPRHLNINKAFGAISPKKDVDGFNPLNIGKLAIGEETFISCTPYGIVKMLEEYKIETEGKHVVILGRSNIVGKPLIQCMLNLNSTVTVTSVLVASSGLIVFSTTSGAIVSISNSTIVEL